ncbi:ABC transporter permease, partial [Aegicerativicinus sediminis]
MLKNYLKIAWRNIIRNKGFSFLNIAGLSIGLAATMLILLWVGFEVSYDNFHEKKDRIFETYNRYNVSGEIWAWNTTPKIMAQAIKNDYQEVEKVARLDWPNSALFSFKEKRINADGHMVDPEFLDMFSFKLIKGDPKTALEGVNSVIITQSLAQSLFGTENVLGELVKVDNEHEFKITGVMENPPKNSSFNFEYLIPWAYMVQLGYDDDHWGNNSTTTYVLLKEGVDATAFNNKIKTLRSKYDKDSPDMETFLHPFTRKHLYSNFENGQEAGGRIDIIRMFTIIAGFILLIACINFMNLSTARSEKRAKEVGIRKVVGAQKQSLIGQFMGESFFITIIAGLFALLVVAIFLPSFNQLVGKELSINFTNKWFWLSGLSILLITGIVAGSYPALYLSSFRPVSVLKGTFKKVNTLIAPRKVLVVLQFTFAISLIIATIIVNRQLKNAQDRQMGYSKDGLVYVMMEGDTRKNYSLIKNELLSSGVAESVVKTSSPITQGWSNSWGFEWQGKDPNNRTIIDRFCADDKIVKTAGLELVAGRDFDLNSFPADSTAMIINESAVKLMQFDDPIGKIVKDNDIDWHVIGVIKDFVLKSPFQPIEPLAIEGAKGWFNVIHFKLNKENSVADNLAKAETIFKKFNPEYPFTYKFVDEEYQEKFDNQKKTCDLASIFTVLAIIISCLGLFGLA